MVKPVQQTFFHSVLNENKHHIDFTEFHNLELNY